MLTDNTIKELFSDDTKKVIKALNLCLLNKKIVAVDSNALEILYQLLGHPKYKIRQKSENLLRFFIQNNPEHVNLHYDHMDLMLSTSKFDGKIWYRFSRLMASISKRSRMNIRPLLEILDSDGYPQCLSVFILREIIDLDENLLLNELFNLLSKENDSEMSPDSYLVSDDNKTGLKKAICWIFWHNPRLISLQSLELLSLFTNDEDREVRRLSCEILIPLVKNSEYQTALIEIFVDRLYDSSRRVQRIAIENLLSPTFTQPKEKPLFIDRIINLFSNEDWEIRKNACESLPPNAIFHSYGTNTRPFLDKLVSMLDDPRWEIRETVVISLSQHLDLEKEENIDILVKIFSLVDDTHEQVRKTCCNIISHNINVNHELKIQFIGKIINLITDKSPFVRQEALHSLSTILTGQNWYSVLPDIFENLFRVIDDSDKNVRAKAWKLLNELTYNLSEPYFKEVITKTLPLSDNPDEEIRYFSLTFLRSLLSTPKTEKSLIYTVAYLLPLKQKVLTLLKDKEATVSGTAWQIVLENKTIFIDRRKDMRNIFLDLNVLSPQISQYACDVCVEFGWIEQDASIRDILINLLCKTDNREIKKRILNAFLPFKEKFYLSKQIIFQLINDGQWDVQEKVCQFLIPLINEKISYSEFHEILKVIIDLLGDPIKEYYSSSSEQATSVTTITTDLEKILTEENFHLFFDNSNDDLRFEKWLQLEKIFDLVRKISHPNSSMIIEQFITLIANEIKHLNKDLGYNELLSEDISINTPFKIISFMSKQQEIVRFSLLKNIEKSIDFSQKKFDQLRKAIISSLDDISLKIRNISSNILRNTIITTTGLEKNLESILQLTSSTNADTRIRTISILLDQISITEFESEYILTDLINLLDDHCYLVRIQIWSILENEINISYPKYEYIVRKVLTLVSNGNIKIRKEAEKFIEQNLKVFLSVIENYPQPSNVLHLLGKIYGKGENYEKGIKFFYQIIEKKPLDTNSWVAIALINVLTRNFEEVIRILKKVQQEIDQFDYRIYLIWSECLLEMGKQLESNEMKEIARLLRE